MWPPSPRPRGSPPTPIRCGSGASLIPARDTSGSVRLPLPQVDVAVRLNTNESPLPPPERGSKHARRRPDLDFTAIRPRRHRPAQRVGDVPRVRPDQVFCANGSTRCAPDAASRYGGPDRAAAVFERPTRCTRSSPAIHGTGVIVGAAPTTSPSTSTSGGHPADITFVARPTTRPGGRAREVVEKVLDIAPGLVVVDEAYGQFSPWSALSLVDDDAGVVVVRTFSKTWAMAAVRLGYLVGPAPLVAALDQVVLPYHLSALTQAAGRLALKYRAEMEARVATIVEERGKVGAGLADLDVEVWPSDANFILFRPRKLEGAEVWQRLLDQSVLCATARRGRVGRVLARDDRNPGGMRRSERIEGRIEMSRTAERRGRRRRPDLRPSRRTARAEQRGYRAPVLRPTAPSWASTAASISMSSPRAISTSTPPHRRGHGHCLGEALSECAGRQGGRRASRRSFSARRGGWRWPSTCTAGRSASTRSRSPATFSPGYPAVAPHGEHFSSIRDECGLTLHIRGRSGHNTHHVLEAAFKGVARCLRDAVRVEGTSVPSTKGTL